MAMQILVEEGIDALKMPVLSDRLDCAVGALYRYFPGKSALMVALQLRAIGAFRDHLDGVLGAAPAVDGDGDRALHRLRVGALAFLEFGTSSPAAFGLIDAVLSDPRSLLSDTEAQRVQELLDDILGRFAVLFDQAVSLGVLRPGDARMRTHVLWAALHGASHFRKRDPRQPDSLASRRVAEEALSTLLRGWAPGA